MHRSAVIRRNAMLGSLPVADPSLSAQFNSLVVIFGQNQNEFWSKIGQPRHF
jgi:hypothetical protein